VARGGKRGRSKIAKKVEEVVEEAAENLTRRGRGGGGRRRGGQDGGSRRRRDRDNENRDSADRDSADRDKADRDGQGQQDQQGGTREDGQAGQPDGPVKLTAGGKRHIGNLEDIKDVPARQAVTDRGGGAQQVNQIRSDYQDLSVGELANRAAKGDTDAVTALKMIKQAGSKRQKYSGRDG